MSLNYPQLPQYQTLWQSTTDWLPSPQQQQLWQQFYEEILSINSVLNLTRITTPEDFWEKNIWDSVAPIIKQNLTNKKVIDIGTGGGFPAIPLAIIFSETQFYPMDSTTKKVNFIDKVVKKLGLENVKTIIDRAETLGQNSQYRASFDFALIRAVAKISVCLEYSLPLLKIGGIAILYRGNFEQEDKNQLDKIADKLGGKITKIINQNTPLNNYTRHCIYVEKVKNTPAQFPRDVGKPVKNPLEN